MHFEIVGEIADVETIATGSGSAKSPARANAMAAAVGENERVMLRYDSTAAKSPGPRYTGMKRPASEVDQFG
jgi:hypothetical protein